MGTRGLLAFHHQNRTLASYNHADSYPGGLGLDVLHFLRTALENPQTGLPELRRRVADLRLVYGDELPTPEDIACLEPYTSLAVSNQSTSDWYCLLRYTQGGPETILRAGYILDAFDFGYSSGLCEWAYVIDLDGYALDVYEGFYTGGEPTGLWSTAESRGDPGKSGESVPITRIAGFPLFDLPTDDEFLAQTDPQDPEEKTSPTQNTQNTQNGGIDLVVQAGSAASPLALHRERLIDAIAKAWGYSSAAEVRSVDDGEWGDLNALADAVLAIAVDLDSPEAIEAAEQAARETWVRGSSDSTQMLISVRAALRALRDLAGNK